MNEKNEEIHNEESFPLDSNILNQLVEQITAVAALDFSKKITNNLHFLCRFALKLDQLLSEFHRYSQIVQNIEFCQKPKISE